MFSIFYREDWYVYLNMIFVVGTACGKGLRNQVLPSDDGADDGAVGV